MRKPAHSMNPVTVAFDADDTLWSNEEMFADGEQFFRDIAAPWAKPDDADRALLATERMNTKTFGFGVKSFCLSMIETIISLSDGEVPAATIGAITDKAHQMMHAPTELLPGVADTLRTLAPTYRLIIVTKGDLMHQLRRVEESAVGALFDDVEVVSTKDPAVYRRLLRRHRIDTDRFVMVGNSLASDVVPVVEIGARAIHLPYHIEWALDHSDPPPPNDRWAEGASILDVPRILHQMFDQGDDRDA